MASRDRFKTMYTPLNLRAEPPVQTFPESELWSLEKRGHVAKAIVKSLPHGRELRAEVDGSLIRARLFRIGESGLKQRPPNGARRLRLAAGGHLSCNRDQHMGRK